MPVISEFQQGLLLYCTAGGLTAASVVFDRYTHKPYNRKLTEYGCYDLSVVPEKKGYFSDSFRAVIFGCFVAAAVESVYSKWTSFSAVGMMIVGILTYILFGALLTFLNNIAHRRAIRLVSSNGDLIQSRKAVHDEYTLLIATGAPETNDDGYDVHAEKPNLRGLKDVLRESIDNELKGEGHRLVREFSVALGILSVIIWGVAGGMLFFTDPHSLLP